MTAAEDRSTGIRVGGMALENGLLLHSAGHWAAAVRESDGSVSVASGEKSRSPSAEGGRIPLLRGLVRLADALAVIPAVKARMGSAVLPLESKRVLAAMAGSMAASAALRRSKMPLLGRELGALVVGLAPTLIALKGSDLASYHGAEHKSIGEYEQALVGGRAGDATKEHDRCGSNLVGPLAGFGLLSSLVLRKLSDKPSAPAVLATGLLSAGAAMEVFRWMSRHPDSPLSQALSWPGHALQQAVTTEEPSEAQMEVARAALGELLRLEGLPDPR